MTPLAAPQLWSTRCAAIRRVHGKDRGRGGSNRTDWGNSSLWWSRIDGVRVAFDFGPIPRPPSSGHPLASVLVLLPRRVSGANMVVSDVKGKYEWSWISMYP